MKAAIFAGLALLGMTVASAGTIEAKVTDGSLALTDAQVSSNGRALLVQGDVQCDAGQRVRVTVNTRSGPDALGRTAFVCDGTLQHFELTVRMRGSGPRFSDIAGAQFFARADTGDDVDSWVGDLVW